MNEVADDPCMSIDDWLCALLMLREAFGGKSMLRTDGGHNNVSLILAPASPCAYPRCVNYRPRVRRYCCNGCSWDHASLREITNAA